MLPFTLPFSLFGYIASLTLIVVIAVLNQPFHPDMFLTRENTLLLLAFFNILCFVAYSTTLQSLTEQQERDDG